MTTTVALAPGDFVVYPNHGVGKVTGLETQTVSGQEIPSIVIRFDQDRMTLRLPLSKAAASGLRRISTRAHMDQALSTLKGQASKTRTIWRHRATEYATKINSGDPVSLAEVVRDLHRDEAEPQGSYSERQLYESARERLTREVAAVEGIEVEVATTKLEELLKAA